MRILVTGARGFVGRHVLHELVQSGHTALPLVHRPSGKDVACDIREAGEIERVIGELKPDACIHLAGMAFVPTSWSEPHLTFAVNVIGTVNLLEAFRRHAPEARIVVASTSQIYGNKPQKAPLTEDGPMNPDNLYAASKLTADLMALLYARRYNMPVMTARPCNHIGPGQSSDFVVAAFAEQVAEIAAGRHEPLIKVGNLASEREFTDVRDIARAYRLLVEKGQPGNAYNLATGEFVKIRHILDVLCQIAGIKPRIEVDPTRFRPTDTQPRLDTTRIERDVQWKPHRKLHDTLRDILSSARQR